jgi:hypothetical protein
MYEVPVLERGIVSTERRLRYLQTEVEQEQWVEKGISINHGKGSALHTKYRAAERFSIKWFIQHYRYYLCAHRSS